MLSYLAPLHGKVIQQVPVTRLFGVRRRRRRRSHSQSRHEQEAVCVFRRAGERNAGLEEERVFVIMFVNAEVSVLLFQSST